MKTFVLLLLYSIFSFANDSSKSTIHVGSSPTISSAGIYLAIESGYFKDEGLIVDLTVFNNSSAPMTLLLSKGELDVGAGNLTAGMFNAINKGERVKIVADKGHVDKNNEYIALLVRKDLIDSKKYSTLKDLKGLKISLPSLDGISQQIVISKILSSAGLSEKDVTFLKLSYPEASVALKTKSIDATIQLEPYLTKSIIDNSAVAVASSNDYVPNQQSAAIFFSSNFIEKRRPDAVKFMKAYLKGVRLYNATLKNSVLSDTTIALLKRHIIIDDDNVWKKMRTIGLNNNGEISLASIEKDLSWYREKEFITTIPKNEAIFDLSIAKDAVAELIDKSKK
ncbi:MAG: ABC transporter substrate-binding protein [Pseudobdellovibrio sp.]